MSNPQFSWTDENVTALKKLWGSGKSASEIARTIGAPSRNAVIGKASRLNLPKQEKKRAPQKRAVNNNDAPARPLPVIDRSDAHKAFGKNPCGLMDLGPQQCRWPVGDPKAKDFVFCAAPRGRHHNYCDRHAAMAGDYRRAPRPQNAQERPL